MCPEHRILVFWGGEFMAVSKQFTIGFSKPQFTCLGKQIEKNYFWEYHGFPTSSIIWPSFWFLGQKFRQGVTKLHSANPDEGFEDFFWKNVDFSVIFAPRAEKFRTFAEHLGQRFQNINLGVQVIILRITFKKVIFSSKFCTLRKKFWESERKNSRQAFKTHILCVHENILTK